MMIKNKLIPFLFILLLNPILANAGEWDDLSSQVVEAYKAGEYARGTVLAEQALKLANKKLGRKHPDTLISMNNLALLYRSQGLYEKAEPFLVETLALRKEVLGLKHPDTLISMNNLAALYQYQGLYEQAEPLYVETLTLFKEVQGLKHRNTLSSMNNLAEIYRLQGLYEQAEPLYVETLALRKEVLGLKHPLTLISMNNLAALYQYQGLYEQAEPLYVESLALIKEVQGLKHPDTLLSMNNLALLYQSQGLYEQAEPLFVESLVLNKKMLGLKHPQTLNSMNNLATLYQYQGLYEQAEPLFVETLALIKEVLGLKHPNTLISMNNLALLYQSQGLYEQAEPLLVETLALRKEVLGLKHPHTLNSMNNLAELYRFQGLYEQAEPILVETLALIKEVLGLKHPHTLLSMSNLAEIYRLQGLYEQADPLFVETLALRKEVLGLKHPDTLLSMNNLAWLYQSQGLYDQAESLLVETLALIKEVLGLMHPNTLYSMNNLALLYQSQGLYEKAEPILVETLALNKKVLGLKHPNTLKSMNNLATLYQATQQWIQAQTLWNDYLIHSNQFLNQVLWGASEKTRLSYIQQEKGFRNNILSFYSHLASPTNHSENTASFSDIDLALVSQQAWQVSISRKGLLLKISSEVSALSKIHQSSDPELTQLSEQIKQTRSQLATLAFSAKPNPKQQAELEQQFNTLQRQLGSSVSRFRHKTKDINPEQIISALTKQQAIVDFMVFKEMDLTTQDYKTEQLIALLVAPKQGVQLIKLGELAPISQLIQTYRRAIEPKIKENSKGITYYDFNSERQQTLSKASKALYEKLWKPLAHVLQDKQQVFLIPDGILHLLPFKALQDEQGQYLNQQIQITRLGSARDIVIPPLNNKTTDSTIFTNPAYAAKSAALITDRAQNRTVSRSLRGLGFSPLPGTKAESENIQKILQKMQQPVNLYSQLAATETNIRQQKSPKILHIATHGFFLENIKVPESTGKSEHFQFTGSGKAGITNVENPLARSGLALTFANQGILGIKQTDGSDGILTALEVLNLKLEGTELVTLSACETGVGEINVGEGVYSLNRAFQEAGAKAVLSTLWRLDDEGTNNFMQKFYRRFLNRKSAQQALKETQDELKNSKKWQDPFFWAPFVIMGI